MALRADINLSLAFQTNRNHLGDSSRSRPARSRGCPALVRVLPNVVGAGTVASFAGNTENKLLLVEMESPFRIAEILKVGRVAFQTPRIDYAIKIRSSIDVSRTVHPAVEAFPVRNRQFE